MQLGICSFIMVLIASVVFFALNYMRFQTTNQGPFKMTTDTWTGDIVLNPPGGSSKHVNTIIWLCGLNQTAEESSKEWIK
jgi:hypothetical protein